MTYYETITKNNGIKLHRTFTPEFFYLLLDSKQWNRQKFLNGDISAYEIEDENGNLVYCLFRN